MPGRTKKDILKELQETQRELEKLRSRDVSVISEDSHTQTRDLITLLRERDEEARRREEDHRQQIDAILNHLSTAHQNSSKATMPNVKPAPPPKLSADVNVAQFKTWKKVF